MVARTLTERWGVLLKQSFIVDNQAGGGGVIACQSTARAAPDGYTLLQGYVATHGTSPATRKVPYDALKDFTAIGMIGATPNVLVVNSALPVKNVKEFIEYVKKNPGKLSYGSAGQGSLTHLTMELFKQQIDSFMVHIPYRGIAPAFTDLIGGQTQAMFPGLAAAMPHIRSGRVRPLAVTGLQRHPQYKDLPTLDESGFKGFDAQQWYGVVGPAGMPAPIVKQLNDTMAAVLQSPELREKLSVEAIEPMVMTPEKFAALPAGSKPILTAGPRSPKTATFNSKANSPWHAIPKLPQTTTHRQSPRFSPSSWPPIPHAAGATQWTMKPTAPL